MVLGEYAIYLKASLAAVGPPEIIVYILVFAKTVHSPVPSNSWNGGVLPSVEISASVS